ncbi:uncharacterized protein BJ171DRAFT_596697 [Polychytrium aggregatum]|uniref:uncharacterized protein n=1 Tax=Polychytrium aggregatum TaxID=110093 RepID=UPI0022FE5BEE|nr:uncharacterized protein BJ171DRAFT_596697 [Polychytrium aggregatum]KAI9207706.1 hypothetical protein BJ171DRAFT_596697 [Polychytrium aggregatum]
MSALSDQIEILQSIYCSEGELDVEPSLLDWLQSRQSGCPGSKPSVLQFAVNVQVPDTAVSIRLHCRCPLLCPTNNHDDTEIELDRPSFHFGTSASLSRELHEALSERLDELVERIFAERDPSECTPSMMTMEIIAWIHDDGARLIQESTLAASGPPQDSSPSQDAGPLVFAREWVYFPSLSTKEKRKDLVDYALRLGLTGFVTPGKPGVLVVEGLDTHINTYFHEIRTVSWADLPPAHKKMTLRHRDKQAISSVRELDALRKFKGMVEIVFDLHGARGNRNSLFKMETFLAEAGCADAFGKLFPEFGQELRSQ